MNPVLSTFHRSQRPSTSTTACSFLNRVAIRVYEARMLKHKQKENPNERHQATCFMLAVIVSIILWIFTKWERENREQREMAEAQNRRVTPSI